MFSQPLCAPITKYAGLSALLLVEIISLLIIFFVAPCTTAYFAWFIRQRVAVLDIPEIEHTQAAFLITTFHAFFLALLAWGTIPYYSFIGAFSRKSQICVYVGFWLLFLAYICTSMFMIHVVAYWEGIFDINNMAAISKECKAMLFVAAISLILALVLVTIFMRLKGHEGLFPPLMEQVFADFRFSVRRVGRFLYSKPDGKRIDAAAAQEVVYRTGRVGSERSGQASEVMGIDTEK
ncbi:hypothetical protein NW761_012105 [Fusarium oxysporum]|nr:hypothetical protein NW761_012105 [Fusarium oxysporum]